MPSGYSFPHCLLQITVSQLKIITDNKREPNRFLYFMLDSTILDKSEESLSVWVSIILFSGKFCVYCFKIWKKNHPDIKICNHPWYYIPARSVLLLELKSQIAAVKHQKFIFVEFGTWCPYIAACLKWNSNW